MGLETFPALQDGKPSPLAPLPDLTGEEDGLNPPNISQVIHFGDRRLGRAVVDAVGGLVDGKWEPIDFGRIVPVPEDVAGRPWRIQRAWGEAAWGVDHNAGGSELLDDGVAIRFFTQAIPLPVLKALAEKLPDVSWRYFAAGWHQQVHAEGRAEEGVFTMTIHYPADAATVARIQKAVFGGKGSA